MKFQIRQPARANTRRKSPPHLTDFVAFLDANPNTWAAYFTYTSRNGANSCRRRARGLYTHLGYEFVERIESNGFTIYGRKIDHTLARLLAG